jgi:hypothetical protein
MAGFYFRRRRSRPDREYARVNMCEAHPTGPDHAEK